MIFFFSTNCFEGSEIASIFAYRTIPLKISSWNEIVLYFDNFVENLLIYFFEL